MEPAANFLTILGRSATVLRKGRMSACEVVEEQACSTDGSLVRVSNEPHFSSERESVGHDRHEVAFSNGDVYVTGGDARATSQGRNLCRHAVRAETEILAAQSRGWPTSCPKDMHVSIKAYQAVARQFRWRCRQAANLDIATIRVEPRATEPTRRA